MTQKILVAEDEAHLRKVILAYLKKEDFVARGVADGETALELIAEFKPDLLVLDLMLPGLSGEEVCQRIRQNSDLPILMLTAKGKTADKIKGFNIGADDYLVKPFISRELIARIRAILRRSDFKASKCELMVLGKDRIKINFSGMTVTVGGKDIELTATEFKLLQTLIRNPNQVLSREQLADRALGFEFEGFDRTIDVHLKNIRRKLGLKKDEYIKTIYGAGYKFVNDGYE